MYAVLSIISDELYKSSGMLIYMLGQPEILSKIMLMLRFIINLFEVLMKGELPMPEDEAKSGVKVFISYAKEDVTIAKRLYNDLKQFGANPWMDKENLLAGHNWKVIIPNEIHKSRFFIALLSSKSLSKKGYVQAEMKNALEILEEVPSHEIFIIPARLDNCVPMDEKLKCLHRADLFPSYEDGLTNILRTLKLEDKNGDSWKKWLTKIKYIFIFFFILIILYKSIPVIINKLPNGSEVKVDNKEVIIKEPEKIDKSICSHYWICFLDDTNENVVWPKIQVQSEEEYVKISSTISIPRSFKSGSRVFACTDKNGSDYFTDWLRIDGIGASCKKPDIFSILDKRRITKADGENTQE